MKKEFLAIAFALSLTLPCIPASSNHLVQAEEAVQEHKLALTSGTLKMGGIYGTTSAYYKLQGTWNDYPDTTGSQYLDAGFIVNEIGCDSSINMSYYANYETWTTANSGQPYGAVRIKSNKAERIGSGTDQDGFFETVNTLNSSGTSLGKFFSDISNPVTIRYDAEAKARTLPEYTYGTDTTWLAKGGAKNYSGRSAAYAGFQVPYFGIGWYVGPFAIDLTNLCFYDDDYNSLGCTADANPTSLSLDLYGRVGSRVYIGGLQDDTEALLDQNGQKLSGFQSEGDGIYSFLMPDYDVTVTPKQKETELNITLNGASYSTSIEWSLQNLQDAIDDSGLVGTNDVVLGYRFDGRLFETANDLYAYINTLDKSYSLDIEIVVVYLQMNQEATMRTVIDSAGLRFTGKVRGSVDEFGMITTRYKNLTSLDKFTMEDLAEGQYRKVSSLQEDFHSISKDGYTEFSTVIANMKEEHILDKYVGRLYAKFTYDNGTTKTIYSPIDDSYLALPYEAGLVAAEQLSEQEASDPENQELYDLKRQAIHKYYDPVCNIDSSYHLIGNGRNYTVEKIEDGSIRIVPLNDLMSAQDVKYLLVNGTKVNFTRNDDVISFNADYISPITITSLYNGDQMEIFSKGVRGYLEADTADKQAAYLKTYSGNSYDTQTGTLSWKSLGSVVNYYLLYVSEDPTFLDAYCFKTTGNSYTPGVLIPGRTYYYKVVAIANNSVFNQSDVDSLVTCGDFSLRQINISGVPNVRDEGGWMTESGQTVNYSLLYRGACLNGHSGRQPNSTGLYVINNVLNWKSEIDFRTTGNDDLDLSGNAQTVNAFNSDYPYVKSTITQALYIFPGWSQSSPVSRSYDSRTKNSLKAAFANLSDIDNYPVYFHCNAGADRTGTFGYLALGLLGVSYEDLCKDFELTSFSVMGRRWRSGITSEGVFDDTGVMEDDANNYVAFGKMHDYMMANYATEDGKLSSAINNYLVNAIGIPQEQINAFKDIML